MRVPPSLFLGGKSKRLAPPSHGKEEGAERISFTAESAEQLHD
jgi:hypothetical protein